MCSIVKFPSKASARLERVQKFKLQLEEMALEAIYQATQVPDEKELQGIGAAILVQAAQTTAQIAYVVGADLEALRPQFLDAHQISVKHFKELME